MLAGAVFMLAFGAGAQAQPTAYPKPTELPNPYRLVEGWPTLPKSMNGGRWGEVIRVHVATELQGYIVDVVEATRHHRDLMLGVSPRGALALQRASRALAASVGRSYVVPDDVKVLAPAVLEHRLVLSSEAMMRGVDPGDVLAAILDSVPVPANRAG